MAERLPFEDAAFTWRHTRAVEFTLWVERMRTSKVQADAIRELQAAASESVMRHFGIGPNGSFDLDVALFQASKPAA